MYRVSAWNSGGEGDMSVPLPGYLPRSKLTLCIHSESLFGGDIEMTHNGPCVLAVPNSIAADQVAIQTANGALHIRLHVSCEQDTSYL